MKRMLVVGNWKMNGDRARNELLLEGIRGHLPAAIDVAICAPFPYLAQVGEGCSGAGSQLGAQDVSQFPDGAFTGEVSATMLRDLGVRYVIVGHSERRAMFGETDRIVGAKAKVALAEGLMPIVCIGETLDERECGIVEAVLARQLDALLEGVAPGDWARLVLAYEPVWAIGTGRTATPEQVQEVLGFVRAWLRNKGLDAEAVRVLYGGSVKPESAVDLFGLPDCDGGLIGGASLDARLFLGICEAAVVAAQSKFN